MINITFHTLYVFFILSALYMRLKERERNRQVRKRTGRGREVEKVPGLLQSIENKDGNHTRGWLHHFYDTC